LKNKGILLVLCLLLPVAPATAETAPTASYATKIALVRPSADVGRSSKAWNCVAYARAIGGFDLAGDGWRWWQNAAGVYDRSSQPTIGAALVFRRSGAMHQGHVAVVEAIYDERTVLVRHANWAPRGGRKGQISTEYVFDISPRNDWTEVRVEHQASQTYGRPYPTYGFILPGRRVASR
jgi:surface antigen